MSWIVRLLAPVSVLAFAPIHPVQAQSREPIECVFQGVSSADVEGAIRAGSATPTASDTAAQQKLLRTVGDCSARYNWTGNQRSAAVNYTVGRVSYENSVQALSKRGVPLEIADQIQSDLGENWLARLTSATEADDVAFGQIAMRRLIAINYKLPDDEAEWERLGQEVGSLLAGRHMRDEAAAAFRAR